MPDHGIEALGIGHRARLDKAFGQPLGRLFHGRGVERDEDVLRLEHVAELHSRSLRSGTTSAGRFMTATPARASAAIFSAAVPLDPEMIAPAKPPRPGVAWDTPGRGGLAGDEADHGFGHRLLHEVGGLLL